ncbi:class I SAM-dependent methyltransferase [candidate division KSB1 bacterium]|nr:MAG: class I SAM-dependent methyltransferase [candidate division KSB1 bacterium]
MIEQHEINRRRWNEITPVHARSEFYDVPGFLAGRNTLFEIELDGVGDVNGKSLLHLQCHFGMDSLSWARLGAQVVGVDFSEASIEQARDLAQQARLADRCQFICCDVLELDQHLTEKFDVVFTSYGVITWLCDLEKWARIVAHFLKPGGLFFIAEIHPLALMFRENTDKFELAYDYFSNAAEVVIPPGPDYADPSFVPTHGENYWAWTIADIFHALKKAGLEIGEFNEYPYSCYPQFPNMTQQADGRWILPAGIPRLPLLFSLAAHQKL